MQDDKAVVRRFLAALGRGDNETLKQLVTDDLVAVCTGTSLVSGTRDHAQVMATAGMLKSATRDGIEFRVLAMTAEDDRVACEMEGYATLVNGVPYNNQYHFLFYLRGGRVCRIKEYLDTKLADQALGPLLAQAASR